MATTLQEVDNILTNWGLMHIPNEIESIIKTRFPTDNYKNSSGTNILPILVSILDDGTYVRITGMAFNFKVEQASLPLFELACFLIQNSHSFLRFDIELGDKGWYIKPYVEIPLLDTPLTDELFREYFDQLVYQVDYVFLQLYQALTNGNYNLHKVASDDWCMEHLTLPNLPELFAKLPKEYLEAALQRKRAIASN